MLDQSFLTPAAPASESEQILALQEELRRVTGSRNDFMVGMSHRIRTPLSGVMGMVELLTNSALDGDQRIYADNALCAGRSLIRVFDELLDFCRGEAGELVLERETFSPAQVASDVMGVFASEAQAKGLLLTTTVSPEVPSTIDGDPARLHQVLHELIENALRFTRDGQIQIGIRPVAREGTPDKLLLWVEDTGEGMNEEQLTDLFEFCFESAESEGLTIGLPAARHIVEAMGGNIDVESEQGNGTTVRFTLPVTPCWKHDVSRETPAFASAADSQRRTARVLVVEDDLVNQRVTLGYLKLVGYEGHVVDSGEAALRALVEGDYDLILMDKMMPGMDGLEATRAIRDSDPDVRDPGIPIIALTAEVSTEARRECLAAGMNDYLTKPIRKSEIAPVIRAWLPPNLRPQLNRKTQSR